MSFLYTPLLFITFVLTHLIFLQSKSLSRWMPFLMVGILGFGLVLINHLWDEGKRSQLLNRISALPLTPINYLYRLLCATAIFFCIRDIAYSSGQVYWNGGAWIILGILIWITSHQLLKENISNRDTSINILLTNALFIFSFIEYLNFVAISKVIFDNLMYSIVILGAVSYITYKFISNDSAKSKTIQLFGLEYLIFAYLAFRSDNLFSTDGSEYHWSYYTDVIRSVQVGGILLWDTPSQYGFLNILLASMISTDAWQGLYLLQGGFLFLVTSATYTFTSNILKNNRFGWLLAFGCAFVFFFADPSLIGPQPYPSSSVIRFGPSFLLLLAISYSLLRESSERFLSLFLKGLIPSLYIFGILWSAESFIYCTVILLGYILAKCIQHAQPSTLAITKLIFHEVLFYAGLSLIAIGVIASYYKITYGVFPDIEMFFMYGKYYSAGFGAYSLKLYSSLLILLIPLILLFNILFINAKPRPSQARKVGALIVITAAIFAWMSYYIGRAVPNNIGAISPMIIYCYLLILVAIKELRGEIIQSLLRNCIYVFIFMHISSILIQPKFLGQFFDGGFKGFNPNIADSRRAASPELLGLINALPNSKDQSFVFYGASGPLPYIAAIDQLSSEQPWIPQPFALLEEPIPVLIREKILARYAKNHLFNGYIVLDKPNHSEKKYAEWLKVLGPYTQCKEINNNERYALFKCSAAN